MGITKNPAHAGSQISLRTRKNRTERLYHVKITCTSGPLYPIPSIPACSLGTARFAFIQPRGTVPLFRTRIPFRLSVPLPCNATLSEQAKKRTHPMELAWPVLNATCHGGCRRRVFSWFPEMATSTQSLVPVWKIPLHLWRKKPRIERVSADLKGPSTENIHSDFVDMRASKGRIPGSPLCHPSSAEFPLDRLGRETPGVSDI